MARPSGSGRLTTHVLDTARGRPAAGVRITLWRLREGVARERIAEAITNEDGRTDAPLLSGAGFETGEYELEFAAGTYLRATGAPVSEPGFLDVIPIRFAMAEEALYHVPLLLAAHGYSTYRGS
ncbi:MAG: hydroxyisourate hydrolase [Pseudomonadota bacterium]